MATKWVEEEILYDSRKDHDSPHQRVPEDEEAHEAVGDSIQAANDNENKYEESDACAGDDNVNDAEDRVSDTTNVERVKEEKLFHEMLDWKNKGMEKKTVQEWDSATLARGLAAFILNYEKAHVQDFQRLYDVLLEEFRALYISGGTFILADDVNDTEYLLHVATKAMHKVVGSAALNAVRIRLKAFVRKIRE